MSHFVKTGQTGTNRDKPGQNGTNRDKPGQNGTNRDKPGQNGTNYALRHDTGHTLRHTLWKVLIYIEITFCQKSRKVTFIKSKKRTSSHTHTLLQIEK